MKADDFRASIVGLVLLLWWFYGIVKAVGFWSTFASVAFPPWAMYLAVEHLVLRFGL